MRKQVMRKDVATLVQLIFNHGYWSDQVKEYLSQFEYKAMTRLDNKAKSIIRENNKAS